MSGIETTGSKRLVLVSGRAHPELAEQIAEELGSELVPTDARTFANGEIYARYDESVRGSDAFVMRPPCDVYYRVEQFPSGNLSIGSPGIRGHSTGHPLPWSANMHLG